MFEFNINDHNYSHVHFIGIGGISMSAIAEILNSYGYRVTGSDANPSSITEDLKSKGITVYNYHSARNINGSDLVIYTDAVSLDNPELKAAIREKIDIVDRASFLGALMKNYEIAIAVTGTHGKTTTTSMLTEIIFHNEKNPTILLGGKLDEINGNVKIGSEKLFLTEACEYRANILKYFPTTAIVLNIDEDHLDYFDNIDHIIDTFKKFTSNLTPKDLLVLNIDDENARTLLDSENCQIITTSISQDANYMAKNIRFNEKSMPLYDLYHNGKFIDTVELSVLGYHNVSNSLCAIAAACENGISFDEAIQGIKNYTGVHRRLEFKGFYNKAKVMDDYAHHPTEIKTTLDAIRKTCEGKLYCVFQPHTFTRTKLLLESFSKSFTATDFTIITDIYAAREKDYGDIHSKTLSEAIIANGDNAIYMENFEDIVEYMKENLQEKDILVTMGAGDVYKIGEMLLNESTKDI